MKSRLLAFSALSLILCSCQSTGEAIHSAASALEPRYAAALAATRAAVSLLPLVELDQEGPGTFAQRMQDYAGANRFANQELRESRENMRADQQGFAESRNQLRNEEFGRFKASLRGGPGVPDRGRLGQRLGLPNPFGDGRLLLPEPQVQPVLHALMPGFGR